MWLAIRATDPKLNRDAYGAEITVHTGAARYFRILNPSAGYLSSNPAVSYFGLGSAASFDRIEVLWPNGAREEFGGGPADRPIELRKGSGRKP